MPVVFINPPQNPNSFVTTARVVVVAKVAGATKIVVCCDDHSRNILEGTNVCRQCPSFVRDSCAASPGDTCSWGVHVGYGALTGFQQEMVRKSSYLKDVFTPEVEVKQ